MRSANNGNRDEFHTTSQKTNEELVILGTYRHMSVITIGIQDKRHTFTFSCRPIFHYCNPVDKNQEQLFVKGKRKRVRESEELGFE